MRANNLVSSLIIQSVYVIVLYFWILPWLRHQMTNEVHTLIQLFDLV